MQLRLPIGYDNFAKLIEKKLDFVDKTLFIREMLSDDTSAEIIVITRPRRFGNKKFRHTTYFTFRDCVSS